MRGVVDHLKRKAAGPAILRHPLIKMLSCVFLMAIVLQYSGILLLTQRYTMSRLYDVMYMVASRDNVNVSGRERSLLSGNDVRGGSESILDSSSSQHHHITSHRTKDVSQLSDPEKGSIGKLDTQLNGEPPFKDGGYYSNYEYDNNKNMINHEVPQQKLKEEGIIQETALYNADDGKPLSNKAAEYQDSAEAAGDYSKIKVPFNSENDHLTRNKGPEPTKPSVMGPMWNFFNRIRDGLLPVTITTTPKPLLPCPKQPPDLDGPVPVMFSAPDWETLENAHPEVYPGGHWVPRNCSARHQVALVIPFRDRDNHLRIFLQHMHPFLQRQLLDYTIYVIEQAEGTDFNRAMLMNVGFAEAEKLRHHDCFVFHDVDLLPEIAQNMYSCPHLPRHMSAAVDSLGYRLPYQGIFGGVSALRTEHFRRVNGFSNCFFGWGGEDDDMYNRIKYHGLDITRYPLHIARYRMLSHKKEMPSNDRFTMLNSGKLRYDIDGISSLVYDLQLVEKRRLYTLIRVQLNKEEVLKRSRPIDSLDTEETQDETNDNRIQINDYNESQDQLLQKGPPDSDQMVYVETKRTTLDPKGENAEKKFLSLAGRLEKLLRAHNAIFKEQEEQNTELTNSVGTNPNNRATQNNKSYSERRTSGKPLMRTSSRAVKSNDPTS